MHCQKRTQTSKTKNFQENQEYEGMVEVNKENKHVT